MSLEDLRAALDAADDDLLAALARRAALVREIWNFKEVHGLPRLDAAREAALRARLVARGVELGLSADAVAQILDRVVGKPL